MKKKLFIALIAAVMMFSLPMTVCAGEWQQDPKGFWYLNDDGTKPAGEWKLINNNLYYFKSDGYMNTGWIKVSDQWYYCEPTGVMRTAELQTDVFTFRFNSDGSCSNFYQNTTPSTQAGWSNYGTTSLSTWANAITAGNIVYYNGSYWAKPDYVSSLKNQQVVYMHDISKDTVPQDINSPLLAEQQVIDRYTLAEVDFELIEVEEEFEDSYSLDGHQ